MQVDARCHNEDGEKQAVTENPPVAEGIPKEELPYRFVKNVREQGTQHKKPVVHALHQRDTTRVTDRTRITAPVYFSSLEPFAFPEGILTKGYLAPEPGSTQRDPGMSKWQHLA